MAFVAVLGSGGEATQADTVTLEPVGSIGIVQGPDEYQFGFVTDIAVDPNGNVYVVDQTFSRIQVYDTTGTHVNTLGRKGPGPREFMFPRQIAIGGDSLLVVSDEGKRLFSIFTLDGSLLLNTVPLSGGGHYFDGIHLDEGGWLYDGRQGWGERSNHSFVLAFPMSNSGSVLQASDSIQIPRSEFEAIEVSGTTGYTGRVEQPLSVRTLWTVLPDGTVAATNGESCEVVLRKRRMETPQTLTCDVPRHPIPDRRTRQRHFQSVLQQLREQAEMAGIPPRSLQGRLIAPANYPRFVGMTADSHGGLWVLAPIPNSADVSLIRLMGPGAQPPVVRVTGPQGIIPESLAIGGGWMYLRSRDDLGVDRVLRYRLPAR